MSKAYEYEIKTRINSLANHIIHRFIIRSDPI